MANQKITDVKFKFSHYDQPSLVYTYWPAGVITWEQGFNNPQSTSGYPKEIVQKYIKDGTWIVVEDKS